MGVLRNLTDAGGSRSVIDLDRRVPRLTSPLIPPAERRPSDPEQPTTPGTEARTSKFAPVRGVTLELFADIARAVASQHDSSTRGIELAASCDISAADWLVACRTWNTRIADNPDVAKTLSGFYRAPVVVDLREASASRAS